MIEFAYNDHIHSSSGVSPNYILYGHEFRTLVTLSTPYTKFENINNMINEIMKLENQQS